jgi:peroxin-6
MPSAVLEKPLNEINKSISTTANVHFINDPTLSEQFDTIQLSFELFIRVFPDTGSDDSNNISENKFVLIKLLGAPDYFKEFKIYRVTSIDHSAPTSNSVIFINHSNLLKFDNQLTLNSCVIQSIDYSCIPTIESLFVSVPPNIYLTLHDKPLTSIREQFINTFLLNSGSVVGTGDIIRSINGEVKLSEPVSQGIVSNNTNIVLIKTVENDNDDIDYNEKEIEDQEVSEDDLDSEIHLDLSTYLSSSLQIDSPAVHSVKLKVEPLPAKMSVDMLPPIWLKEDTELFVFANTAELPKLGFPVFNGDSVKLNYNNDKMIVKLFTFIEPNKSFRRRTLYLSPILLANLKLSSNSEVTLEPIRQRDHPFTNFFPVAKSVTISRVSSHITMDKTYQQHFFSELKTTFHKNLKCVKRGDFVPVVIDTVLAKTMFDTNNLIQQQQQLQPGEEENAPDMGVIPTGDPDEVAWFKIVDISGESHENETNQFIIDPTKTRLISSGVEFIKLPPNDFTHWYQYLKLPPVFNFNKAIDSNPTCFKYVSEFKKIVTTSLNSRSKINLKTTILLNSMTRGLGKTTMVRSVSTELGLNLIELDCFDLINPGAELKTIGLLTGKIDKLIGAQENSTDTDSSYHVIYLKHIENLCAQSNQNEQGANITTSLSLKVIQTLNEYLNDYSNLMIIMSCNDLDKLNENLRLLIKFQIDFSVPDEKERLEVFKFLIENETHKLINSNNPEPFEDREEFEDQFDVSTVSFSRRHDISFSSLALQSAGLTPRDLMSIIKKAKRLAISRLMGLAKDSNISLEKLIKVGNGGLITWIPEDFNKAINDARNQFSDSIGAPRIPDVKWEDIGGLDLVKDEIMDTIDMPLKHPELFSNGLKKRSGILFYGPPGTGKTLLAKAIATNFSLNFFSVKGPELLNMYIGESEANVRRVFQKARDAKPCVIFFDELDSVAPKRGNQGDSGGVMDRIVSQLLAELDGMSGGAEGGGDGVFVVGATNRPDLLDEALLRPGRFDKMLYLGISDTDEKQSKILEALTRKFKLADNVDLYEIAKRCSFTFTGADFYALCSDSMLNAMTRTANEVDAKIKKLNEELTSQGKEEISTRWWFDNAATPEDTDVLVQMEDFKKAQSELAPSVSAEELEHYLRVRENFEGGKEKAMANGTTSAANGTSQGIPHEFMQKVEELIGDGIDGIVDENGNHIHASSDH